MTQQPKPIIRGISVHQHHNNTFEWCPDFENRKKVINTEKPKYERPIRNKLFRMLTKKEIAMLPVEFVNACREYGEAYQKWEKANQKWEEACHKQKEACQKWEEAYQKRKEAKQKWEEAYHKYKPQLEEIHKKICGCKEWNGEEIVFE